MTATQAVLAVSIPAAIVLAILAVPAIRRRHAQHQRAVTATAGWCDDDRTAVLSTPEAVAPLRAALDRAGALPAGAPCSSGCGCRTAEDPNRRDCACDGECCMDPDWPHGAPADPFAALIARADEELAANEEFRAWLAGTVPTYLTGGQR